MDAHMNWHENVFFGVHYDLHAQPHDTELGAALTREHLRERLLQVRPDWVQCDCKGHPGYTSWPTRVGSTSPGVVRDALRIHRDVTRELGIKLGVHYSGLWDTRAMELHPDWAQVDAAGTRSPKIACALGPYRRELMIPQLLELVEEYDVDGFWVDGECWAALCCWCARCRAEFGTRTGIAAAPADKSQPHWDEWRAFHRQLFVEHVTEYTRAVQARKPGCLVCSAWMYGAMQPEPVLAAPIDYLSGDWTRHFGTDRLLLDARGLACRGRTWDLMLWWMTKPPQCPATLPWNATTATQLHQDAAEILAQGGAVMLYVNPQRDGWLTGWLNDRVASLAEFCRARRAVCFQTQPVREAAVLHAAAHYNATNPHLFHIETGIPEVEGALHALVETQHSTDLVMEGQSLAGLKLVVVPEQTRLKGDQFAGFDGYVVASGAHLARECPDFVGADPVGDPIQELAILPVGNEAVRVAGPWQPVRPRPGTKALVYRLRGLEPARDQTGDVLVTRRGNVLAIHGPIFRDYYHGHFPQVREFVRQLVAALRIEWTVRVAGPPHLEVVARQQGDRLLVNLINRGATATLSNTRVVTEDVTPIRKVTVRIQRATPPQSVTWEPGGTPLRWSHSARGGLRVEVPRVDLHGVVVVQ